MFFVFFVAAECRA